MKTSHGGREAKFQAEPHSQTSHGGREAKFQAKPHSQTSHGGREAKFIQNYYMVLDTRQAKPHREEKNEQR